jgi:tetratricopeptide (TPR) repeat protein
LILLAITAGVIATIREARIAAANQHRAEQRFNDVRKLASSLMFEIHDAIRDLPGSTPARRLLVNRALEYLDNLSKESNGDASLQKEMAAAYDRVGDVLGYPYAANLGDHPGALRSYRKALAIRESLLSVSASDSELQRGIVGSYLRLAQVLESDGNFSDALAALAKALPIAEQLAAANKTDPLLADHLAGVYYFTASTQVKTGDVNAALGNYRHAAEVRGGALQDHPENVSLLSHLAADDAGIAKCLELNHNLPNAIAMQLKAVSLLKDVSKANPTNTTLAEFLGESLNRLATYRELQGDGAAALETYRQAHSIFADLRAADPKNSLAKSNFGFSDCDIAHILLGLGEPVAAAKIYREAVDTFEQMSPLTASNRYPRTGLAKAYSGLADAYSVLALADNTPAALRMKYWNYAHSACESSLSLWKEKDKRGELESDEHGYSEAISKCLSTSEAHLHSSAPQQARLN